MRYSNISLSVYINTHKVIELYPLYRILVGLSIYLSTLKAIKHYPLYRTMVALTVRKQSLYSTNYILGLMIQYEMKPTNRSVQILLNSISNSIVIY